MNLKYLVRENSGIFDQATVVDEEELLELRRFLAQNLNRQDVVLEEDLHRSRELEKEASKHIKALVEEPDFYVYLNNNPFALKMSIDTFLSNFDDLFFPGGDDVYLMDIRREFVIGLDHEEIIKIYALAR